MPLTARGQLKWDSANRVTAVFVIDKVNRTFTATVSPSMEAFTSSTATLTYNDVADLTGTRTYSGRIGPEDFALELKNKVKIDGDLNIPGLPTGNTVNGNGNWEQN